MTLCDDRPMKRSNWKNKVFDAPRVGFVEQFGSRLRRAVAAPEHPPAPPPSPLDKIIDENRLGLAGEQRRANAQSMAGRHDLWTEEE